MTDAAGIVGQAGQPAPSDRSTPSDRSARGQGSDRWRLLDEQEFLRRSLEDAELEHAAGDLADADYALLHRRDATRLAAVESAIAAQDPPPPADGASGSAAPDGGDLAPGPAPAPTGDAARRTRARKDRPAGARLDGRQRRWWRPRRRRWVAVVGVACLVAGTALLAVELSSPRLPGEAPTGSIDLSQAQKEARQLQQARSLVNGGHPAQALQAYGQLLAEDPKNPVALAEWGWLEWQAATAAKQENAAADGEAAVARAVHLEPSLYAAQYYLGTMLVDGGKATKAVARFRTFLGDHPSAKWLDDAAPAIRRAFGAAGVPVPAGVPPASTP
ncbi:MAG: tetratricopeptide repeat protein, partial [Acidimicrobiales bacterium]